MLEVRAFTDCAGIEAPIEALYALQSVGCVGEIVHAGSCEVDDGVRNLSLCLHKEPETVFANMLHRDFDRGGVSFDLASQCQSKLPSDVRMYVIGFPCQPFSQRNVHSSIWGHPSAKIVFAMLDTLQVMKPEVGVLENVKGLVTRGAAALIVKNIVAMDLFFVAMIDWVDPEDIGLDVQRPRIHIVCVRKDCAAVSSHDELKALVSDFMKLITERVSKKRGRVSFTRALKKHMGIESAPTPKSSSFKPCDRTLDVTCERHWCKCCKCQGCRAPGLRHLAVVRHEWISRRRHLPDDRDGQQNRLDQHGRADVSAVGVAPHGIPCQSARF